VHVRHFLRSIRRATSPAEVSHKDRPARITTAHIADVASRLTARDRRIALDCYEHRALTTQQLRQLHLPGIRTARARLHHLYELRVLDRFRPSWQRGEGSTPYHWILDEAGAYIVAAELGIERNELRWRHADAIALARSAKLTHQVEVNEFFTRLAQEARALGGALADWQGERSASALLGRLVTPDGYGRLTLPPSRDLHLFLELDRGTEDHARLQAKARRYAKALSRSSLQALEPIVILAVPTTARASTAANALATARAPMAPVTWNPRRGSACEAVAEARRAVSVTMGRRSCAPG
jgi:hypothetical protein